MRLIPLVLLALFSALTGCTRQESARLIACDPGKITCTNETSFGPMTLQMIPRPTPVMTPFGIEVTIAQPLDSVLIDLNGRDMDMGPNTVRMLQVAPGKWQGSATIPICLTGQMPWQASLVLSAQARKETLRFEFETAAR